MGIRAAFDRAMVEPGEYFEHEVDWANDNPDTTFAYRSKHRWELVAVNHRMPEDRWDFFWKRRVL